MERPIQRSGSSYKVLCPKHLQWRAKTACYACSFFQGMRDAKVKCVYMEGENPTDP